MIVIGFSGTIIDNYIIVNVRVIDFVFNIITHIDNTVIITANVVVMFTNLIIIFDYSTFNVTEVRKLTVL